MNTNAVHVCCSRSGRRLQVPGVRPVFTLHGEQPDEGGSVSVRAGLPVGGQPALSERVRPAAGLLPGRGVPHRSWTWSPVQVKTVQSEETKQNQPENLQHHQRPTAKLLPSVEFD